MKCNGCVRVLVDLYRLFTGRRGAAPYTPELGEMSAEEVLYVCDRKRCEHCSDFCEYTTDINHAVNFHKDESTGVWIERDGVVALGEIDEFSEMSEKQNIDQGE